MQKATLTIAVLTLLIAILTSGSFANPLIAEEYIASAEESVMADFELTSQDQTLELWKQVKDCLNNNDYGKAIPILKNIISLNEGSADAEKAKMLLGPCQEYQQNSLSSVDWTTGKKAGDRKVVSVNGVEFAFRWCPAGTFTMGSPDGEDGRWEIEKQHQVTLTKGFWMLETEVTQKQWKAIMRNNPSCYKIADDYPADSISWKDCQDFCQKCAELAFPIKLPTEAQWEYACRAGTTGMRAGSVDEMAWYKDNSQNKTHPVKTKTPNAWGLYDMYGNVWEWCQDWYGEYPNGSVTNPPGPETGLTHVSRGAAYDSSKNRCRSAARTEHGVYNSPPNSPRRKPPFDYAFSCYGFRVVVTP